MKVLTVFDEYLREIGARVVRVTYGFSLIDIGGPSVHDGHMRKLSIAELVFILRCPGWRMRAALLLWLIGLRDLAQRVIRGQRGSAR